MPLNYFANMLTCLDIKTEAYVTRNNILTIYKYCIIRMFSSLPPLSPISYVDNLFIHMTIHHQWLEMSIWFAQNGFDVIICQVLLLPKRLFREEALFS